MRVDLRALEKHGYDPKKLEEKFTLTREERMKTEDGEKINAIIDLHTQRISVAVLRNLNDARHWYAIDTAYDINNRQISPTLMWGMMDGSKKPEEILSCFKEWGLTSMLTPFLDNAGAWPNGLDGKPRSTKLDLPIFFNVFIPVVAAYHKIRWAKLWNDRDVDPLYKYSPARLTNDAMLKCEMVTNRIQRMSQDMGYASVERDSIFKMLLYGAAINFPREPYYSVKQKFYIENDEGVEELQDKVIQEGVRFHLPHISRTFWDLSAPLHTLNSDTGIAFFGHWQMERLQEIMANKYYWNIDKLTWGENQWPTSPAWKIYQELYPCMANFPTFNYTAGTGDQDREKKAFIYHRTTPDAGVNITVMFDKIIPADSGLYDYPYPVWHRFIYGAQGTVLHCQPFGYTPGCAYLYDYDADRARGSSLGLELIPFQDHMGNLLTQYLLSVKQNLSKVVFWNSDSLDQKDIDKIVNMGEQMYRVVNFIPFSEKDFVNRIQTQIQNAFHPVDFPRQNTQEILSAINTFISVMERMLGYSSQEVGAAATHEQSAHETEIISQSTSNRMQFTGGFVDDGMFARQKLLYDAFMSYGDDEILAEVTDMDEVKQQTLKDWGFEVELPHNGSNRRGVKGSKKSLDIDSFASNREGVNRSVDTKIAMAMLQVFPLMFQNPIALQAIGIKNLLNKFNDILNYLGVPGDWRFDPANAQTPDQAMAQTVQIVQGIIGKEVPPMVEKMVTDAATHVGQQVTQQVGAPLVQKMQQTDSALAQLAQGLHQTSAAVGANAQSTDAKLQQLVALIHSLSNLSNPNLPAVPPPTAHIPVHPPQDIPPIPPPVLQQGNAPVAPPILQGPPPAPPQA